MLKNVASGGATGYMYLKRKNEFNFRVDSYGETLLVTSKDIDKQTEFIKKNNITNLEIDDEYYELNHIDFLENCPEIERLTIQHFYLNTYRGLEKLFKLRSLNLLETKTKLSLDLKKLLNLESLYCQWTNKITGLEFLTDLKKLSLWKYTPRSKNLKECSGLTNLEYLNLTQAKIDSLIGIEKLVNLKHLELNYLSKLKELKFDKHLGEALRTLEITNCKAIERFEDIQYLSSLEEIKISNCNEIASISFLRALKNVKILIIENTNVADGDMSFCDGIENVYFDDKKHYNYKLKDFTNE